MVLDRTFSLESKDAGKTEYVAPVSTSAFTHSTWLPFPSLMPMRVWNTPMYLSPSAHTNSGLSPANYIIAEGLSVALLPK